LGRRGRSGRVKRGPGPGLGTVAAFLPTGGAVMGRPICARILTWAVLLPLALCADVKDSFLEPHRLPTLVQHRQRVLATICGVWEFPEHGGSPDKLDLLHTILESYTSMCEAGYELQVVLVTYEGANKTLTLPRHKFYCDRLATTLPIAIARFEHHPLPAFRACTPCSAPAQSPALVSGTGGASTCCL